MKLFCITLGLIFCYFLLQNISYYTQKKNNSHYIGTYNLEKGLYIEKFKIYNWFSEPSGFYSEYITDSLSFRKYIGTCNDYAFLSIQRFKDSLVIKKVNTEDTLKIYEKNVYKLSSLKKEHIY